METVEVPEPVPGPDDVRVRVLQCGICGTDVHGSLCYGIAEGRWEFEQALDLVAHLVTHTLPLERADEALRIAADKTTGSIKVAVPHAGLSVPASASSLWSCCSWIVPLGP